MQLLTTMALLVSDEGEMHHYSPARPELQGQTNADADVNVLSCLLCFLCLMIMYVPFSFERKRGQHRLDLQACVNTGERKTSTNALVELTKR